MEFNSTQNWRMGFQEQRTNLTGVSKGQAFSYKIIWEKKRRSVLMRVYCYRILVGYPEAVVGHWSTGQAGKFFQWNWQRWLADGFGVKVPKMPLSAYRSLKREPLWYEPLWVVRKMQHVWHFGATWVSLIDCDGQLGKDPVTVFTNMIAWYQTMNGKMCRRNLRCGWLWDLDPTKKNTRIGQLGLWLFELNWYLIIMQMLVCREERKMYFSVCLCAEIGRGSKIQRGWWSLNGDAFSDSVAFLMSIQPKVVGTLLTTKNKKDSHVMDQNV